MRRLLPIVAGPLLALALAGTALAADPLGYEEIKLNNSVMVDQMNQERSGMEHLAPKYGLGKVAYNRSLARALERDRTGTSEFAHDTGAGSPIQDYLDANGICWNTYAEVVGYSNRLRVSPPAATADDIVDRWMASPNHRPYVQASWGDWGGGAWVRSDSGTYFFAAYVVDVCGT